MRRKRPRNTFIDAVSTPLKSANKIWGEDLNVSASSDTNFFFCSLVSMKKDGNLSTSLRVFVRGARTKKNCGHAAAQGNPEASGRTPRKVFSPQARGAFCLRLVITLHEHNILSSGLCLLCLGFSFLLTYPLHLIRYTLF